MTDVSRQFRRLVTALQSTSTRPTPLNPPLVPLGIRTDFYHVLSYVIYSYRVPIVELCLNYGYNLLPVGGIRCVILCGINQTLVELFRSYSRRDVRAVQVKPAHRPGNIRVNIIYITLSIWKRHNFETIFTSNDVLNIQDSIGNLFGYC